jgi:hypothetical protein
MMKCSSKALLLLALRVSVNAQTDTAFIHHLNRSGLAYEEKKYVSSLSPSDTVSRYKAAIYLREQNGKQFLDHFTDAGKIAAEDTTLILHADRYFLRLSPASLTSRWFNEVRPADRESATIKKIYAAANDPLVYSHSDFVPELSNVFTKYRRLMKKKPVLASVMSACIPGLGKAYAGKYRSGATSFIICASYALQTAESYQHYGFKNGLSIVNAAAFAVFYISGIYGSYTGLVQLRKEYKKQFINDALFYYR